MGPRLKNGELSQPAPPAQHRHTGADLESGQRPRPDPNHGDPMSTGMLIAGTYRVLGPLGQGGMGTVWLAMDERLQREVAIKLVGPQMLTSRRARERFVIEARAMARVRHPNVVEIFAFGELGDTPYFVMEYVPGTNLANWLDDCLNAGRLPAIDEALGYLDPLCRAVSAIHDSGFVHGDLKPSNILLGPACRVAIADMGLARILEPRETTGWDLHHPMAGTPAYMAPEFTRTDLSPGLIRRSDVYALGVLAFELLTGEPPWDIETTADMLRVHARGPRPKASEIRPELTSAFDRALLDALHPNPHMRLPSAEALRSALFAAREQLTTHCRRLRILVADDDRDFRALARETLAFAFPGSQIEAVGDGHAALDACDRERPSLAVVDLDMPGLNGLELTAALQADRPLPILVVTASGGAPDWKLLQTLGASGFLVKPIDPYALVTLARRAIGI